MSRFTDQQRAAAPGDVTASEAATYVFCAKAWHLERVLDVAGSDEATERRGRGVTQHELQAARVQAFAHARPRLLRLGVALLVAALALIAIALLVDGR